jgi:peptidoglycan/xylan/chitin deacetylase (PgdA/CDA1 family)
MVYQSTYEINYSKLIQGYYEAERLPRDFSPERIVPDFAFNILNPLGLLYRPIVNEAYLANGGEIPSWPEDRSFAVCLTHDVDSVSANSLRQSARAHVEKIHKEISHKSIVKSLVDFGLDVGRVLTDTRAQDPLHIYERWLEVENAVGAKSTFFFWPGWSSVSKHHHTDCTYDLTDKIVFDGQQCTVSEMIREIHHRGWEIGLHPSWYSFDDVDEMKRQKEALEEELGHEVISVRQHYLHYDIRITPRVQTLAGFKYDSTLGFNDNIGFRFGTCYPWQLYDLKAETELPIIEMPLIIQDGAMLNSAKGMRIDEETAFEYVKQLTEAVERVGGVLTLLWHTNSVIDYPLWILYLRTLDYLKQKNVWYGSVKDLALTYTQCSL